MASSAINRANAQHSTGPVSVEGKAVTRFNAMKHGIDAESLVIPGEDQEELARLTAEFFEQFRPQGALEVAYTDAIVRAEWFRRRYVAIEAQVYKAILKDMIDPTATQGDAFYRDGMGKNVLGKIHRRQQAAMREYNFAVASLINLQQARAEFTREIAQATVQAHAPVPAPAPRPAAPAPENGRHPAPIPGQPWVGSEPLSWRL